MILLVVALTAEARPLIARYGLGPGAASNGFRVYRKGEVSLILSGPGKDRAAAATRHLHAVCGGGRNRVFINVGIGGHASHPVGKAVLAHKVVDVARGECFYPPLVIRRPTETAEIRTVPQPEEDYPEGAVYEMEAAGFYQAATRFSTGELVQTVKVVSDNRERSFRALTASDVDDLIRGRLDEIGQVIDETARWAHELSVRDADPPHYAEILERWRFTVTERRRLRELLQRWQVLSGGLGVKPRDIENLKNAGAVLGRLERGLQDLPVRIG